MMRDRLDAEGEARRHQQFHMCQMAGLTRKETDKALREFTEKWNDHMLDVLEAECEDLMAVADFVQERDKAREEKRKGKKDES